MKIIIGRVTKDLETKTTGSGTPFVNFDVAENIGYGEKATTIYHRCAIFGEELVNKIVNAKVKKGSFLKVVGGQKLDAYIRESDKKAIPTSEIDVWHWEYVNAGSGKAGNNENAASEGASTGVPTEDCDDGLPV